MVIVRALVADICGDDVSVTFTVNDEVPDVVGVPEIFPVVPVKVKPAGRDPDRIDHVYGVVPPVAAKVPEYATPTVPFGSDVVEIDSGAITLKVKDLSEVWFGEEESVTLMPADELPTVVGVPEMVPVAAFSVSPAGKAPDAIDHV